MGSDLYLSIDVNRTNDPHRNPRHWSSLFQGPSEALARGIVVDAFGDCDPESDIGKASGYLTDDEIVKQQEHPECPWRLDEPYWVRRIDGPEFVAIIAEKRWQRLQKAPDGSYDFHDKECSAELRAFAALVQSLLNDGCNVIVYCWHSQ